MKKIRLQLDALTVDSFETGAARPFEGTVQGRQDEPAGVVGATTPQSPCLPETFPTCPRRRTEYASCIAYCECTDGIRACIGRDL